MSTLIKTLQDAESCGVPMVYQKLLNGRSVLSNCKNKTVSGLSTVGSTSRDKKTFNLLTLNFTDQSSISFSGCVNCNDTSFFDKKNSSDFSDILNNQLSDTNLDITCDKGNPTVVSYRVTLSVFPNKGYTFIFKCNDDGSKDVLGVVINYKKELTNNV